MSNFYESMAQFTGSTQLYHHPLHRTPNYTDGVRFFLQNAGKKGGTAYWLLDLIATEPAIRKQAQDMAFITLDVKDSKARLWVTNGHNDKPVYEREIEYTDVYAGTWKFYWRDDVLMVPSEY